jgi:hypothetical protein
MSRNAVYFRFTIVCLAAAMLMALAPAQQADSGGATVIFRKVFKLSYPEFVEIKVKQDGTATADIRQLDDDPSPEPFDITGGLVQRIFQLTAELHDFDGISLEVHRKLANLGEKTFRYEKGSDTHEVHFNYTMDPNASQLLDIFEGLAREETDLSNLTRTMRYDRLGVDDALEHVEADYNNKVLPEPERLLHTLDQLAADEKYIDIARQRARNLAARIRSGRP